MDDGGNDARGEPLVGRGSALRVGPNGGHAHVGAVDDRDTHDRDEDRREGRWVPRPSLTSSSRGRLWLRAGGQTPTARLVLGFVLVAVLALAWAWVGRGGSTARPSVTATTVVREPRRVESIVTVPRWVPDSIAATCRARKTDAPSVVVVDCKPGRGVVALQYRGFASVDALRDAYTALSPRGGGGGPAACARGVTEERSWSAPDSPALPDGRYRCSLVEGRARLVWSSEQSGVLVLATASRVDGDLRSLYQWWTTVPGPDRP